MDKVVSPPDPVDVQLGQAIRRRRLSSRMTQERLAAALGVSFQQVQKYESGKNRVSYSRLVAMAEALGCSLAELSGGLVQPAPAEDPCHDLLRVDGAREALEAFAAIGSWKLRRAMIEHMRRLADVGAAEEPLRRKDHAGVAVR